MWTEEYVLFVHNLYTNGALRVTLTILSLFCCILFSFNRQVPLSLSCHWSIQIQNQITHLLMVRPIFLYLLHLLICCVIFYHFLAQTILLNVPMYSVIILYLPVFPHVKHSTFHLYFTCSRIHGLSFSFLSHQVIPCLLVRPCQVRLVV